MKRVKCDSHFGFIDEGDEPEIGGEPETGFSRINLRPLEIAADVTAAVATLGMSVLIKKFIGK